MKVLFLRDNALTKSTIKRKKFKNKGIKISLCCFRLEL